MIKKLLIISSLLTSTLIAADKKDDEWKVSGRLNAYVQTIHTHGNGSASKEGETHNEELNLNYRGPLGSGEAGIETRVRGTNDKRIQKSDGELLYLRSYYKDKIWAVEAGDVALSLNPYIYSGSVKGAKATYKSPDKKHALNYSLLTGLKKASWKELYSAQQNEAPTAYSGAFEVKYIHERAKEIAISIAGHKDDLATGDTSVVTNGKEGYGIGLDGKWRFNKYLTLKGRAGFTDGTDDVRNYKPKSSHGAVLLKLFTRPVLKSVKSNFVYQRVEPNFVSFGGSANDDKEQIENSTTWTINKELRARMDLKGNRDNLDSKLEATQKLHYEALTLTYKPSFIKRSDMTFRGTNKGLKGRGSDTVTHTGGVNLNIRQKTGFRYGGGYDYSDVNNKMTAISSVTTHTIKALLGYKAKLSKISSYRFTIKPSYLVIESQENKFGLKVDAGYVYNKQLSMDLLYLLHQTDYTDINANDTQNSTYQIRGAYKLSAKGSDAIRVLFEKRDIDVDDRADSTYSEYKGKVSLVMNF